MLHYPKIPGGRDCPGGQCIAFEKYDGTNLHWDWDRDFGWHAFGSRRDQFNLAPDGIGQFAAAHAQLHEAPDLFFGTMAKGIEGVLRDNSCYRNVASIKVFTEFLGPNSFAGLHKAKDPKRLVLFDMWAEGLGLVGPRRFVTDFGRLPIARVVYEGRFTGKFSQDVRKGKYGVAEGVICKGGEGFDPWMVKVKTDAYLARLKVAFAERWEEYWE
jgi:RNA ligase